MLKSVSVFNHCNGIITVAGEGEKWKYVYVPEARAFAIAKKLDDLGYSYRPFLGGGLGYVAEKVT